MGARQPPGCERSPICKCAPQNPPGASRRARRCRRASIQLLRLPGKRLNAATAVLQPGIQSRGSGVPVSRGWHLANQALKSAEAIDKKNLAMAWESFAASQSRNRSIGHRSWASHFTGWIGYCMRPQKDPKFLGCQMFGGEVDHGLRRVDPAPFPGGSHSPQG